MRNLEIRKTSVLNPSAACRCFARLWLMALLALSAGNALSQPANDYFTNAMRIAGASGFVFGSTTGATNEPNEPLLYTPTAGSGASVWFLWTATDNGVATFDTSGSGFDTLLAAFTGTNLATLTRIAGNDDTTFPFSLQSKITFTAVAGTDYYIAVDGYRGDFGNYRLNWGIPSITVANPPPGPGEIQFSASAYSVNENIPGYASITVLYGGGNNADVTVDYATSDGTAFQNIDYTPASGTLTFAPGETVKSFDIEIRDNAIVNSNKTINLTLSNATGGAVLNGFSTATVTIVDDETVPYVSTAGQFNFSSTFYSVTENETVRAPFGIDLPFFNFHNIRGALITVTRTAGSTGKVMVDYSTVDNFTLPCPNRLSPLASPDCDYTPVSGTLVFDDYQMSTNFVIPVFSDFVLDGSKILNIAISNPRPAPEEDPALIIPTLGAITNATLNILDINRTAAFSIERAYYRIDEYEANLYVDVIYPPGGGPVSVDATTVNNTYGYPVAAGSDYPDSTTFNFPNPAYTDGTTNIVNTRDYVPTTTRLTFGGGVTRRTFVVPIVNDSVVEFNEDIWIRLDPVPGNPPVNPLARFANATILHEDQPAGAADRDWNPNLVSFSNPPFNTTPGANNTVNAVAVQADQKTVIGGDFTAYNAIARNRIARINRDGSIDTTFSPGTGADAFVSAISIYPNSVSSSNALGKIVIGGGFTSYNGIQRNGVARLNTDGSLDTTFTPGNGANGTVRTVLCLSSGKVLIGGEFTRFNGVERNGIARLNENGTLDTAFDPGSGADGTVWALGVDNTSTAIQLSGGQFGFGSAEYRTNIDTRANSGTITVVFSPACVPDSLRVYYGLTLIFDSGPTNEYGGDINCNFASYTGPITYIIPYGPGPATDVTIVINEGSGDPGTVWQFDATIENAVAGSRVLIGGEFTHINGVERNSIARLNANGALDTSFDPGGGADGPVYTLAVQSDLKVVMGGAFNDIDFRIRNRIARLNSDGSLDTGFDPGDGANNSVYSIKLQPDGKPLLGGVFTSLDHVRRVGMARLLTNGLVDTSFMDTAYNQFAGLINPFSFDPPKFVNSLALEANGNIMIGGSFTNLGGNINFEVENAVNAGAWTRQDKAVRYNVARVIGGYTPGPGNASFTFPDYSIDENAGTLAVTLSRVDGRLGTLQADVSTADRLAQSSADYTDTKQTEIWPEFAYVAPVSVGFVGSIYFSVPILDDLLIEGDELLNMLLENHTGSITLGGEFIPLGGARGRFNVPLAIQDNDFNHGIFSFSAPNYTVNENGGTVAVTVLRTNGSSGQVTVQYTTRNGTAFAGSDYTGRTNSLTFGDGETSKNITFQILQDTGVEFDEVFSITLTNAGGGAVLPGGLPTSTISATVTIIDDDYAPGHINFSSTTYSTNEGAGIARIAVTRTGGNSSSASVQVSAANGTATNGLDFLGLTNTLTWSSGDSSTKFVSISIFNDSIIEGPETVSLRLFNPKVAGTNSALLLGNRSTAALTIQDDDFSGQLTFNRPHYFANENGTNAIITVVRTNGIAGMVSVDYVISDGTATRDEDYAATNGTLVLLDGQTSANIVIHLINDDISEGEETVMLSLVNPTNATLGTISTAALTIVDDESSNEPAGALDTSFAAAIGANNPIYALALQPDGKLIVGGDFTTVNNVSRHRVARVFPDGTLDGTFNVGQGPNRPIRAMALQDDGKSIITGFFTLVHGTNRNHIARLNRDGTLDAFFNPGAGADNPIYAVALQADGKVVIGGSFTTFNGVSRPGVAMLNTNGTLNTLFNPGLGADGVVYAVAVQNDGKVLLGGEFGKVANTNRSGIARLNTDGSLDTTFNPGLGANGPVRAITLQPDGKILIGGSFSSINGTNRSKLARLNTDGSLDHVFLSSVSGGNGAVYAMAIQADNKIIVAGDFTRFNDVTRNRITRLIENGKTDPSINFGTGANGFINALAIQPDRKIIIGGGFTIVDDQPRQYMARLHGGSLAGAGSVEFSLPFYTVNEYEANAEITVRRIGGTTGDVKVDFATSNDVTIESAMAGSDYVSTNGTLIFPEGEVRQTFIVRILNDKIVEDPENVDLFLSNPVDGLVLGPQPSATLTIFSDDSVVQFLTATYSANENAVSGNATIAVVRTGATNTTVSVDYKSRDGSATAGQDYFSVNDSLTFAPGETVKLFTIPIINDAAVEGNETVNVFLTNVTANASLGLSSATLTIVDDDFAAGTLNFSSAVYTVNEYEAYATITVVRTNGSTGVISVEYFTSDGTATAGQDYIAVLNTLAFADGETVKTFNVPIIPDYLQETNETVILALGPPRGGAALGSTSTATLTIINNELIHGVLNFTETNYVATESNLTAIVSVSRTLGYSNKVSVAIVTLDGTAKAGLDYVARTNFLEWLDGDTNNKSFTNILVNDNIVEDTEFLTLALTNQTGGATLGSRSTTTLTILDDDTGPGNLSLSSATYTVNENGTNAVITVNRSFGKTGAVSIKYATVAGGTALAGSDYLSTNGTLLFGDGETNKTFVIPILDNFVVEVNKTVRLALSEPTGGASTNGQIIAAVLTIVENDQQAGSIDAGFNNVGADAQIYVVVVQTNNNKLLVGGDFSTFGGLPRSRVARLNPNGAVDAGFDSVGVVNNSVRAILKQAADKVIIAGAFTRAGGLSNSYLGRLLVDGTVDTNFQAGVLGVDNFVYAVATATDNKLVIGGSFTSVNGTNRNNIARVDANGYLDLNFNPGSGANGLVRTVAIVGDGKVYMGGDFTIVNGVNRNHIARLNADGSVDTQFDPGSGANTNVYTLVVQDDGKIVIGGLFTNYNNVARSRLARLNPDGSLDTGFTIGSGADEFVSAIALQADGKLVVGGGFTFFNDVPENRLVRLNANGSIDPTINFGSGANNYISSIAIQPDKKIVIAGGFTEFDSVPRNYIARLNGGENLGSGSMIFTATNYTVLENGTNLTISVRRAIGGSNTVSVKYTTTNGTAIAGLHYTATNGVLNFGPGETLKTFTVYVTDDAQTNANRTIGLVLSDPTGGALLGDPSTSTITIINDDAVIGFAINSYTVSENAGNAIVTVQRTGSSVGTMTVNYATADGTAVFGSDYVAVAGTLTFTNGQTSATFNVPIIDDTAVEGNESLDVLLSAFTGRPTPAPGLVAATLTIVDNDFSSGTMGFGQPIFTVSEQGTNAIISVTRVGGNSGAASVRYFTSPGSATSGLDYSDVSGLLVFGDGESTKTFSIPVYDDELVEGNETVNLFLTNPTGVLLGQSTSTLTILSDEAVFSFAQLAFSVNENATNAVITVVRSPRGTGPVTVQFATSNLTALAGFDYLATNGTLTFAPGQLSNTFAVPIINDTFGEGNETLLLVLTSPTGESVLGTNTAILTIVDDDVSFGFDVSNYLVSEAAGTAYVSIVRTGLTNGAVSVTFATSDGSANAGSDYVFTSLQVNFASGEIIKTVGIPIIDDLIGEGNETVNLNLFSPTNANTNISTTLGTNSTAVLTIIDNEDTLLLDASSYFVNEGDTNAYINVIRNGSPSGTLTVNYATTNGTATSGLDYTNVSGTLVFSAFETIKTITVPIVDDLVAEGNETFFVRLFGITGGAALVSPTNATVTILDNDVSLLFSSSTFSVDESATNALISVTRFGATSNTVSVICVSSNGTATAGVDYVAVSNLLVFGSGITNVTFLLPIIDDLLIEGNETVNLRLINATPTNVAKVGIPATAVLTILDNDNSTIIAAGAAITAESYTPANGIVDAGETVTVNFGMRNVGNVDTVNLVATLLATNGVTPLTPVSNVYGRLVAAGNTVSRAFTFRTTGVTGSVVTATFRLVDGANNLGLVTYAFTLGRSVYTFSNTAGITIVDNAPSAPYPSDIVVSNVVGTVTKVRVTLYNMTHTYPLDIDVMLVGPQGESVMLMSDSGGGNAINNVTLTFDDGVTNRLTETDQIVSGIYQPTNYGAADLFPLPAPSVASRTRILTPSANNNPNGIWRLFVVDDTHDDSGNIAGGWSVEITTSGAVPASADVSVVASSSPNPVIVDHDVRYTLSVTNHGPGTAFGVFLTNILPATATFVTCQGNCTNVNGTIVCSIGDLPSGTGTAILIVAHATAVGSITDEVYVNSAVTDLNTNNNFASIKTSVLPAPSLTLGLKTGQGNDLVLSWPVAASNYTVEQTDTFTPRNWRPVTNGATLSGGKLTIVISPTNQSRFYRLREQ